MNKNYRKIDGMLAMSVAEAVRLLRRHDADGEKVCMEFNGVMLYSDTVTMDSAYLAIVGCTKTEHDKKMKEFHERLMREEKEHKQKIPQLTREWIEKGRLILDKKYWSLWNECVPIRLDDLYQGWELGGCLDIVAALNNGCAMDEAKKIMDEQGHSGMSYGLMRTMVRSFCDRGEEFFNFTKIENRLASNSCEAMCMDD